MFATLDEEKSVDRLSKDIETPVEVGEVYFARDDDLLQKVHRNKHNSGLPFKFLPQNLHLKDNPEKQSNW